MSKMTLEVLSPHGVIFSDKVDSVSVVSLTGEFGILANHVPIFTNLAIGTLRYKAGNQEDYIAVMGGFLEFANNKINIITSSGEIAMDIDHARAKKDMHEAEKELMKKAGEEMFKKAEREMVKAQTRLRTVELLERAGRKPRMY